LSAHTRSYSLTELYT